MLGDMFHSPHQQSHSKTEWSNRKVNSPTYSNLNKSYTGHKSTEVGSQSPYRSRNTSRLEEARRTIDSVITDLEEQNGLNNSAIREVRSVNS